MTQLKQTKTLGNLIKISLLSVACALGLSGSLAGIDTESSAKRQLKNPTQQGSDVVWDCVKFGSYIQDSESNESTPIIWRVLDNGESSGSLLLLSDKILDYRVYNSNTTNVSWETSDIRTWLNSTFYGKAFPNGKPIKNTDGDSVFLLSNADINATYGLTNNRASAKFTAYAAHLSGTEDSTNGAWWLKDIMGSAASYIIDNTGNSQFYMPNTPCGVRPAIRISTTASWKYAGTVNSNGDFEPSEDSSDGIEHLFSFDTTSAEMGEKIPEEGITLYANGLTNGLKTNGDENYKTFTMCTDITGSYLRWIDNASGKMKSLTGKVLIAVTKESQPVVEEYKNKFDNSLKDEIKEAAKTASATIKDGVITVTAKSVPGTVTLWVIDAANPEVNCASCPITVKPTPANIYTYNTAQGSYDKDVSKSTKATIGIGESTTMYICPTYKNTDNEIERIESDAGLTYEASVNNDFFSIAPAAGDTDAFVITAKDLSAGKKATGKATIKCKQNGKKVDISLTAVNGVRGITLENIAEPLTFDSAQNAFTITSSNTAAGSTTLSDAVTGTISVKTTASADKNETLKAKKYNITDVPKVYALASATGYDSEKFANYNTVSIDPKPSNDQKKITATLSKDKQSITIKAAKGTPVNTTSYFMLVYNNKDVVTGTGAETKVEKGYLIFSVKPATKAAEPAPAPDPTDPSTGDDTNNS